MVMPMSNPNPDTFRYHKTSPEVLPLAVMLDIGFPLSLRNVEDLLKERGIEASGKTVRIWNERFDPIFTADIRRKRLVALPSRTPWRWHLDEAILKIKGATRLLWRAFDQDAEVLEAFISKTRSRRAAQSFPRKASRRHGRRLEITTDRTLSYHAALCDRDVSVRQCTGRRLDNRAETLGQPVRRHDHAILRFRPPETQQRVACARTSIRNHVNPERHVYSRDDLQRHRATTLVECVGPGRPDVDAVGQPPSLTPFP